jgi:2-keto-3-deoxy-L-fuconate dehydrogenase
VGRLSGRRVIVTDAGIFMGPDLCTLFAGEGADIITNARDLRETDAAEELIAAAGRVDVLVANLMLRNRRNAVPDTSDEEWAEMFDVMVHPLHRLVRAVLPQMIERRSGKIVVMGSANGLRGSSPRAAYSAARGAQLAYVKNVGIEAAPHGVNVNAIAQNWVENPASYSAAVQAEPGFAERLKEVPAGRLARGRESAALALYLSSSESDFFHGQIFPFSGGWIV